MADMHKVGRHNKQEGNRFEMETAKRFSKWYGKEFHRSPASGAAGWKSVNVDADVLPPTDLDFPFIIECKSDQSSDWTIGNFMDSRKNFPVWCAQAVREALGANGGVKVPLLVVKKSYVRPYMVVPASPKLTTSLAKKHLSYAVSWVKFKSEVDAQEYLYQALAIREDLIMDNLTPAEFEKCYKGYDWQSNNVVELNAKKTKTKTTTEVLKDVHIE